MTDPYIIKSLDDLEKIYEQPAPSIVAGIKTSLHDFHIAYLKQATFVCIGSGSSEGFDVSPRGGEPGFVHVIDKKTVAIPDWRGNNKIETIRNIVKNNYVSLLFLFPGLNFFFRANGIAEVTTNPDLLDAMKRGDKPPFTAIRIHLNQIYLHCGKAAMRSKLWHENGLTDVAGLPSLATMVKEFTKAEETVEEIAENDRTMLRERLY